MDNTRQISYMKGFIPYAFAAFLIGLIGGLTTVLGPAFVQDMNLDYNNTTWTALSLSISSAVCAPILGKLSDVLGRKAMLLLGISIFVIGNIFTAMAPTLTIMLIARFVVGIGTAAIAPTVMSYIITDFPPESMAKGFSLYMLISSGAVIFGPSLGGLILEAWNWRVLMWICVFQSVTFLILCFLTSKNSSQPKDSKNTLNFQLTSSHDSNNKPSFSPPKISDFDKGGAIFIIAFFSLLLCIPSFGQNFGWLSRNFILVLCLTPISFIGLILSEKHAHNPILSAKFMGRKSFFLPVIILFLTQGLMQANMTNVIIFVNYTQPYNTVISGYAISIMYLGMSLGSILLGPLTDRFEPKRILTGSLFLTAVGCGIMLLFSITTTVILLAASLGILGFGLGGNAAIFMKIVLSDLPADTAGSGTGIYGLFRDLAAPFGVAIFVPMFTNHITKHTEQIPSITTAAAAAVNSIHMLSIIEISCVVIGIIIVQFLPKIHNN